MARNGSGVKGLNLALQGGGAHGAFTWGVLDRLLEDERIAIEGISGTSAGAMNAVVMAAGLEKGGREGARAALGRFWRATSRLARLVPLQSLAERALNGYELDSSASYLAFDLVTRFLSPYDFNPLDVSPLRAIIEQEVDFKALRACKGLRLFVSATNVHTGRARIFESHEITVDAVMASACLPFLFQAVEIDGVPYWDGGYMGNPALFPLFRATETEDLLIVQVNPIERLGTPQTAREIQNRLNEITFNASLIAELRAIEFVQRLIDRQAIKWGRYEGYRKLKLHRIDGGAPLAALPASTKLNAAWGFLTQLRDLGRAAAGQFLEANYEAIGKRGTLDLAAEFGIGTRKDPSPVGPAITQQQP